MKFFPPGIVVVTGSEGAVQFRGGQHAVLGVGVIISLGVVSRVVFA